MEVTEDVIREALRAVIDPELGVNIVDLGLVYEISILPEGGVFVEMTLTTQGCPMSSYLSQMARQAVGGVEGVKAYTVNVVFNPAWNPGMMSDAARRQLGGH